MKIKHTLLAMVVALASAFGPVASAAAVPPTIGYQWVSGITQTDATLNAEINPNGLQTYYELQIDTTGNFRFAQNTSCPLKFAPMICLQVMMPGDPLPPGLVQPPEFILPAGASSQHVSVNMAGIGATLQPGTTYYYRAIASNGPGVVYGPTQTFTTPPVGGPPTIDRQWVSDVTPTDATLNAEINPNGLLTKYKLQLDTTGNFKFDQNDGCVLHPPGVFCVQWVLGGNPLPDGLVQPAEYTLPAGFGSQHVSVNMANIGATLQPETTYHYRAIAANGIPFVYGMTQTFVTPPTPAPFEDQQTPAEASPLPGDDEPATPDGLGSAADVSLADDTSKGVRQPRRHARCPVRRGRRAVRREVSSSLSRAGTRVQGRVKAGCTRISPWLSPLPISERVPPYSPPASERGEPESPDETSPNTTVSRRISRTQFAKFFFLSSEPDTEFRCRLDSKPFVACRSPKAYTNLTPGRHAFKVIAIDAFGNADPTPAIDSFTIPKPQPRSR